jgi:8-oxo-dGTP diphosphatase
MTPMREPFGAACFLYHAQSRRVLLQHRTDDAPAFPSHWGMFGGSGEEEDGDDPMRAVRRELREELGLELDPGAVIPLWDYMTDRGSHRYAFLYPWPDPHYSFELGEGQGYGWFTIAEALGTLLLTTNARRDLTLLDEYLTTGGFAGEAPT